ncbi:hypothetical protein ACIBEJ_47765 [Nonomuraea sp. NPDC050790]|uniref:hypothetical protein n=1 Tax=Nonomuraea sp. NPDC050790 TaxID=3364371 RepID=UPI00378CF009
MISVVPREAACDNGVWPWEVFRSTSMPASISMRAMATQSSYRRPAALVGGVHIGACRQLLVDDPQVPRVRGEPQSTLTITFYS